MRNVSLVLFLSILALLSGQAQAGAGEGSTLAFSPLLRAHGTRHLIEDLIPPTRRITEDFDVLIGRDGRVFSFPSSSLNGGPYLTSAFQGTGTSAQIAALFQALAAGHVGAQTSCSFETLPDTTGPYQVTWYGKGARRNIFVVEFGPLGTSSLPACPGEVEGLIRAINDYATAAMP